jgi:hypothetical protein
MEYTPHLRTDKVIPSQATILTELEQTHKSTKKISRKTNCKNLKNLLIVVQAAMEGGY